MKFRVYRGTFQRDALIDALNLKTLNQLDEVPMYGNEPRVKVRAAGPWQEVEVRTHSWDEIDTPEFWKFLEDAVTGFFKFTERQPPIWDLTPWKVLGQKWHFLRKGFHRTNRSNGMPKVGRSVSDSLPRPAERNSCGTISRSSG
jgi:excinuclease ABC subunit A